MIIKQLTINNSRPVHIKHGYIGSLLDIMIVDAINLIGIRTKTISNNDTNTNQ